MSPPTPPLPLSAARKRLDLRARRLKGKSRRKVQKDTREARRRRDKEILEMTAVGAATRTIAAHTGLSAAAVTDIVHRPENAERLAALRDSLKHFTSERLYRVAKPAWDMVETAANAHDAKSFDNGTRGLAALEKISSSVAGEGQKIQVEHSGQVDQRPALDEIRILIGLVTGHSPVPSAPIAPAR